MYEEDLQKEKQLAGKTYLDLVMMQGMSFEAAREFLLSQGLSLSDKVGNQFSIKSNFDFIRLSRTTLNKLEYVGVVNIPKFVENATRKNDYFPSLTHESQYLYEIALTPPE
ncbi:hypothetical protein QA541_05300 [Macrococcus psychrotolerans]|uniref:Uncharacterized protein n=1 Tax=Macrococcus psychrotolerans TaxID=3039389 RepID=A0AAU6R6F7_9STAP